MTLVDFNFLCAGTLSTYRSGTYFEWAETMMMNLWRPSVLLRPTVSSRKLHNRCTLYSDVIDLWHIEKFRIVATSRYYCFLSNNLPCRSDHREKSYARVY